MDFNKLVQSKTFRGFLYGIAAFIIILIVFRLGVVVGFREASFSYRWGDNYHRNFAGPQQGFLNDFSGQNFINAHGIIGQIIKIDDLSLVIKGQDNIEKIVSLKDNTPIQRFRETIKYGDLKTGDYIVVIGEPNKTGQIEANFIRILPPPNANDLNFLPPPHAPKT
ncbi:MAG: hypothetical protein WC518_03375 [Patescibacteria group bacterium]